MFYLRLECDYLSLVCRLRLEGSFRCFWLKVRAVEMYRVARVLHSLLRSLASVVFGFWFL